MKKFKLIELPVLLIGCIIFITLPFQSCEPTEEDNNTCDTCAVAYKPNIYIYPAESIELSLNINFPMGGEIISSIPDYGTGWDFFVEPSGLINDQYTFLFYESSQPDVWQTEKGWIVNKVDLTDFFDKSLADYGFAGQEIQDFTDYWIPRLTEYNFYSIYPQVNADIEKVIEFYFSEKPDNLLRLFYLIEGQISVPELKPVEPNVPMNFERKDFYVVEWGVVLK